MTSFDAPTGVPTAAGGAPDNLRLLELIAFQADVLSTDVDPRATMKIAVERARDLTSADGAVIELADGDDMVYHVTSGTLLPFLGTRLRMGTSMSGLAVRTGETMLCVDSEEDDRVDRDACRQVGLRSMLCVPLVHGRETVGVLKVVSPRPGAFDDGDVVVLRMLCAVIAVAMTKAALIERLQNEASTDALTGLPNRRTWDAAIDAAAARSRRSGHPLSVILIDLNGFKQVNDSRGHDVGDELLREVAGRGAALLRRGELFARLGGDEFAVLAEDTDAAGAQRLGARLVGALRSVIGAAAGCATLQGDESVSELIQRADHSMYADKPGGDDGDFVFAS